MHIGIPRALYYYLYYPFWKTFFESLGHKVVLSSPTNKEILKKGLELCVNDACFPVKIFHGHVASLIGKTDAIFIPRIVSIEKKEYICPKFLGLPDMIKNSIPNLPLIIDAELDLYKGRYRIFEHIFNIGKYLNHNFNEIISASYKALKKQKQYETVMIKQSLIPHDLLENEIDDLDSNIISHRNTSNFNILLLGHSYNIYDDFITMNLIQKLRKQRINFVTSDILPNKIIIEGSKRLSKDLFWTLGKKAMGAAFYFLDKSMIDGVIYVASFGCGPDSLIGELIEKAIKRDYELPFLNLTLDEHSGEAGLNTRIEAFIDVLEGRKYNENHFSTHGQYTYTFKSTFRKPWI